MGVALGAPAILTGRATAANFDPPKGGVLSKAKLDAIGDYFRNEIATDKIPGAIVYIEQYGKPVFDGYFGVRNVATNEPMTPDTIFRIYSMTKPVTSVAAMMLIEEGRLKLDDPVAKFIPAFAETKVGVEVKGEDGQPTLKLEPLKRPILVRDLLLHTSGITYGFYGDSLVRKAYKAAEIYAGDFDNAEFVERIARLPTQEQPGTLWDYGHSTDVLGRILEIVSGKSLYEFEKERLFDPLGMKDTGYYVYDKSKWDRIAEPLPKDGDFRTGMVRNPRVWKKWQSGTGGLVSTIRDFSTFARLILHKGTLDGRQYLKPETFAAMATDHIGPGSGVARDYFYFPGDGFGFGYGLAVRTDPGNAKPPPPGSLGELKWDGAGGTYFIVDPAQDMFMVLMIQTPTERERIKPALKRMIYDALV